MYRYFISYSFQKYDQDMPLFGNTIIETFALILDETAIQVIQDNIEERMKRRGVIIMNYQLMQIKAPNGC